MSNLSFARIMYGATQEQRSSAFAPVSNFPSSFSASTNAAPSSPSNSAPSAGGFFHKAWHALTRHN